MDCPSRSKGGESRLLSFATARFRSRESALLAEHVRGCEACSAYVQLQQNLWDVLDIWEPEPTSMGFDRALYQRIEQLPPATFLQRLSLCWNAMLAKPALPLAVATLLIVAGYAMHMPRLHLSQPAVAVPEPHAAVSVDVDQLNKDVDDLQLLYQMDVVKEPASDAARAM